MADKLSRIVRVIYQGGPSTPMDQLSRIAKAYYEGGSPGDRAAAQTFFDSLDDDEDEEISLEEFLGFMRQEGHQNMNNPHFFRLLDRDGDDILDFTEVMTLYYIIKSGRPFCGGCGEFLPALFFACMECFAGATSQGCCICITCYEQGKFRHLHKRSYFYDNYTLLEITRKELEIERRKGKKLEIKLKEEAKLREIMQYAASTSQAIQVYHQCETSKWSDALKLFETTLSIGNIANNLCSIL